MSSQLDLVLINPSSRAQVYQALGDKLTAIEPPVWAGLMATFVRLKGYSVAIIDAEAFEWWHDRVAAEVEALNPRLAAVVAYGHQPSASTQNMAAASACVRHLKQLSPSRPVLMLGGHVAALPDRTLRDEACDFVATGEGLYTLTDLLAALRAGSSEWAKVRGLGHRAPDGTALLSPGAPLIKDLDREMPGIAWDLLPMPKYRAHNWHCFGGFERQPYAAMYTTLGCPFHCSFCCIQAPFKVGEAESGMKEGINSYRFWSPDTVIAQIDVLVKEFGVRNIKFADEMFVLRPRHIMGIADKIIERGYDLNIWAYTRVDTVKEGFLPKLRKAGVTWLALGIEAASDRVRDDVQKGFGQGEVFETIRTIRESDISVVGNYIFGLPEDDYDTMQATLDLALDLNCEFGNFYCAMAYPGSALYTNALRDGIELPNTWTGYSQHAKDCLPLRTKYLTAAQVLRFRDEAFQTYFNHPRYLEMVANKFGEATARDVQAMTRVPLQRDLLGGAVRTFAERQETASSHA